MKYSVLECVRLCLKETFNDLIITHGSRLGLSGLPITDDVHRLQIHQFKPSQGTEYICGIGINSQKTIIYIYDLTITARSKLGAIQGDLEIADPNSIDSLLGAMKIILEA